MSNYENMTTGERLVGINVSGDVEVAECKRRFANAIYMYTAQGTLVPWLASQTYCQKTV